MLFPSGKIFLSNFPVFNNQPEAAWDKVLKQKEKNKIKNGCFLIPGNPCQQGVSRLYCQILASSGFGRNIQLFWHPQNKNKSFAHSMHNLH